MESKEIAETGLILKVEVGSRICGLNMPGSDDQDLMGVAIEPPSHVIGMSRFEQYIWRTQPEGVRSGPGDVDLTIYSLRKFFGLALAGNPSILMPLFAPDDAIHYRTLAGRMLMCARDNIISKQAGARFLGYMESQRLRMLGLKGGTHTNRPELVEKYGYDTKFAYHMIRLGTQGIELMRDGTITLPMRPGDRKVIMDIRNGQYSKDYVVAWAAELERELKEAIDKSNLPQQPDKAWADQFMVDMYMENWEKRGLV